MKRFWSKVDKAGPVMSGMRRELHTGLSFKSAKVPSANAPVVAHKCHNGAGGCVRPEHLELDTHGGQQRGDKHVFRRHPDRHVRGSKVHTARLTERDVLEVRRLFKTGAYVLEDLAKMYDVYNSNIWCIVHRKTWKHI